MIVQKLEQYKFGNRSFILTQFGHYYNMERLCGKSILKHVKKSSEL